MSNLDKTKQIYAQVGQGKLLEAFEANYAENIVMEEPSGRREGKEACRKYEEQFINRNSDGDLDDGSGTSIL